MVKTKLSLRLDLDLLKRARILAEKEKMTLTQFLTTALLRSVASKEASRVAKSGLLVLVLSLLLTSCNGLALKDEDSAATTTGKVVARVLLCPLTFCFSELGIATASHRDTEQRYVNSLTPEQFERYDARKQQTLGMFLGSGGFQSLQPLLTYQPPISQVPRPLNCYSNTYGAQTSTTCY